MTTTFQLWTVYAPCRRVVLQESERLYVAYPLSHVRVITNSNSERKIPLLTSVFEYLAKSLHSFLDHGWTLMGKVQPKGVVPGIPNVKINTGDKGNLVRQSFLEQLLRIEVRWQVHH
jgi:hypothetical protein